MLQAEVPWLPATFFRATDGKVDEIPEGEIAKSWNTKRNALYGAYEDIFEKDGKTLVYSKAQFEDPGVDYFLSPGERGCAHSHYRMWQRVAAASKPILILEDDVQLCFERQGDLGTSNGSTFTSRLAIGMEECDKKGDVDVLYLGWAGFREGNLRHLEPSTVPPGSALRRAEYVWTTVAYVLWPAGARRLLAAAAPMDQPVDNFMAWECREGRLNAFVLLDEGDDDSTWNGGIVDQVNFTGDTDIQKSDGGDQGDDVLEHLVARGAGC